MSEGRLAVLLLAAGRGQRLGGALPKAFVPVAGVSLLDRSLERLLRVARIDLVQPVIPEGAPPLRESARGGRIAAPVVGGAERQDSVAAGLEALPGNVAWVAVHDAARCLVEPADVERVIDAAAETGAAILARPVGDTIKRVESGAVAETLDRSNLWAVQTPQVFRAELLREAHAAARAAGLVGTDDSQLVERLGVEVRVVLGGERNLKITHPEDLALAERWLDAVAGETR